MYESSVWTKLLSVRNMLKAGVCKAGFQECTLIGSFFLLPIKKNIFRQTHVHTMHCSFQQTYGVLYLMKNMASLMINWGGMRDKPKNT